MSRYIILAVGILSGLCSFTSADIIRGTVTDASDKAPLEGVRVGIDANHYTFTGADGTYEFDTEVLGIDRFSRQFQGEVTWHPATGSFSGRGSTGPFSIQVRNIRGTVIEEFSGTGGSRFKLDGYADGLYSITVSTKSRTVLYRLVSIAGFHSVVIQGASRLQPDNGRELAKMAPTNQVTYEKSGYQTVNRTVEGSQDNVDVQMVRAPVAMLDNGLVKVEFTRSTEVITATAGGRKFIADGSLSETGGTAKMVNVTDREFGAGQAIEVSFANGNRDRIMLFPGWPFVFFRKIHANAGGQNLVIQKFQPVSAALDVGKPVSELKCNGTAGLTNVNHHPGSYSSLSIAHPATRNGVVAGWVTHTRGNGIVFSDIESGKATVTGQIDYGHLTIKPGQSAEMELFVFGYFADARLGLEKYADAIAKAYDITMKRCPTVYCTWYHARASNEGRMKTQAEWLNANLVPFEFDVAQIDDGWQVSKRRFDDYKRSGGYPSGMKPTADNIINNNLTAGLWFMPFAGDGSIPGSWYLKNTDGGRFEETPWAGITLDVTHPEVKDYIAEVTDLIGNQWGYKYFKIDGMYTAGGYGQCYVNDGYKISTCDQRQWADGPMFHAAFMDPDATNTDAYRQGWKIVRETAGDDVFIMGCTVSQNMRTLGSSFGIMDALRIGPDNGTKWRALMQGFDRGGQRYFYNGRVFWIDPDPVYVRIDATEAKTACSAVAITGFMNSTSETYSDLPAEKVDIIKRTIPNHQLTSVRPADYYDRNNPSIWLLTDTTRNVRRDVIGLFNFHESNGMVENYSMEKLGLSGTETYVGYDFWADKFVPAFSGTLNFTLPARNCRILAVRPVSDVPQVISTNRHVTQGIISILEENWDTGSKTLSGTSKVVKNDPYELRIVAMKAGGNWTAGAASVSAEDQTAGVTVGSVSQDGAVVKFTISSPTNREVKWSAGFQ